MADIIITNQEQWDAIPEDSQDWIYIKSSPESRLVIAKPKGYRVEARGNSSVVTRENSSVEAWENSSVVARENSSVVARENSSVVARENSSVVARENSSVEAWENSSVEAWENSSVVARENSSVVARENSSVEAWGNSSVEARGNSSVEAWENSSVEARGNSSVVARGNVQIVKFSEYAKLSATGNARIVNGYPQSIEDYLDFHGIAHKDGIATLYKSVRTDLRSFHSGPSVQYVIGQTIQQDCDTNTSRNCSEGLHVSHLSWALDFGRGEACGELFKVIEVAVPIDKIVLPNECDGKVRTPELMVLREVPVEEWGLYGRTLAKRWKKDEPKLEQAEAVAVAEAEEAVPF
jgi:hypothetical protein